MSAQEQIKINKAAARKKRKKRVLLCVAAAIIVFVLVVIFGFKTKTVTYDGNKHISNEQITERLFAKGLPNSLMYKLFGSFKKIEMPYVSSYDVDIASPTELHITIHEKNIVMYAAQDDGTNIFIDGSGNVIDTSTDTFSDIPKVKGLKYTRLELNSTVTAENQEYFEAALAYANALKKYPEENAVITVTKSGNIYVVIGNISAACGGKENADEKMKKLAQIIPKTTGLKGDLQLQEYDGTQSNIYFKKK